MAKKSNGLLHQVKSFCLVSHQRNEILEPEKKFSEPFLDHPKTFGHRKSRKEFSIHDPLKNNCIVIERDGW